MSGFYRYMLMLMLMMAAHIVAAEKVDIKDVRIWPEPEKTRIVLDLSGPIEYQSFQLANPHRVVVDVTNAQFMAKLNQTVWPHPIKGLRFAPQDQTKLRIVLDLLAPATMSSFTLAPNDQYGHRLVLDIENKSSNSGNTIVKVAPVSPILTVQPSVKKTYVVAIDAGHGGEDPGAIGPRKTYEKTVVLAISHKLAKLINKQPNMRAVLIRESDYYIALRQRMTKARKHEADIFISIHADAFKDKRAHGASVYALSPHGASSEAAKWLAEKENRSDLIGGVSLDDKDDMLASVLLDLSQSATLQSSMVLGNHVLGNLGKLTSLHSKTVQQAGFAVLKSPDVPSILVETGFISNPKNEQSLRTAAYQQKIADAIFQGIVKYKASLYREDLQNTPLLTEKVDKK